MSPRLPLRPSVRPEAAGHGSALSSAAKGAIGFAVGIAGSIALLLEVFWLFFDGEMQNSPRWLGVIVLMTGLATAKLFQRQNFLAHFDRLSFGMKRRFPVAVYGAWALLWLGYLIASKDDLGQWYDDQTQKFWLMLLIPPTAILGAIILFRWADAPKSPPN